MPKKNSEYWGEKFAKLHHLPGEKRRAAEAPKDFFQKKIPPNSPYGGTHRPNQRFFLKCFFFLAKFSQWDNFFQMAKNLCVCVCVCFGGSLIAKICQVFKKNCQVSLYGSNR
jgi:hypothetical protein